MRLLLVMRRCKFLLVAKRLRCGSTWLLGTTLVMMLSDEGRPVLRDFQIDQRYSTRYFSSEESRLRIVEVFGPQSSASCKGAKKLQVQGQSRNEVARTPKHLQLGFKLMDSRSHSWTRQRSCSLLTYFRPQIAFCDLLAQAIAAFISRIFFRSSSYSCSKSPVQPLPVHRWSHLCARRCQECSAYSPKCQSHYHPGPSDAQGAKATHT